MKHVAICVPSGRTWEAEMAVALISVLGATRGCNIQVLMRTGSQISMQRNELVHNALEAPTLTHVFWVDSDIILPPTALAELLAHDQLIVGATYCKKVAPYEMLGELRKTEGPLKRAARLPGGCMLVAADVYRAIEWPWYFEVAHPDKRIITSEDYSFCDKVSAAGYSIWCDLSLSQRITHLGSQAVKLTISGGQT